MLQFVPSKAIASILSEHGNSLIPYLAQGHIADQTPVALRASTSAGPSSSSRSDSVNLQTPATVASASHNQFVDGIGIEKHVLDNFVRSTGRILEHFYAEPFLIFTIFSWILRNDLFAGNR